MSGNPFSPQFSQSNLLRREKDGNVVFEIKFFVVCFYLQHSLGMIICGGAGVTRAMRHPVNTVARVGTLSTIWWRMLRLVKQTLTLLMMKVEEEVIFTATRPANYSRFSFHIHDVLSQLFRAFTKVKFPGKKSPP